MRYLNNHIIRICRSEFQKGRSGHLYGVLELHAFSGNAKSMNSLMFRNIEEVWPILASEETFEYEYPSIKEKRGFSEKRSEFRFDCRCPLMYHHTKIADDSECVENVTGELVDISCGGMRIETKEEVATKGAFHVYIPMEKLSVSFLFRVQVKWRWTNQSGKHLSGLQLINQQ